MKRAILMITSIITCRDFSKGKKLGLVGKLIFGVGALVGIARADSIDVNNVVNSHQINNDVRILHVSEITYPGVSDGLDGYDNSEFMYLENCSGLCSDVNSVGLWKDFRPNTSKRFFDLKLKYKGEVTGEIGNYLNFKFVNTNHFGNKPIIFQQTSNTNNPDKFYPVVDVRRAIAQNGGIVPLKELVAGTYFPDVPYGSGDLEIGTRILADIDDNGKVDFKDYSLLAQDWMAPQGKHVGDIVGPNGIPDGYVDYQDLSAFCGSWLADVNDPNTW